MLIKIKEEWSLINKKTDSSENRKDFLEWLWNNSNKSALTNGYERGNDHEIDEFCEWAVAAS